MPWTFFYEKGQVPRCCERDGVPFAFVKTFRLGKHLDNLNDLDKISDAMVRKIVRANRQPDPQFLIDRIRDDDRVRQTAKERKPVWDSLE